MEFEGGIGVCPQKVKGNGREPGQKELHVGRRGSVKSRQRKRKHHWDASGEGWEVLPRQRRLDLEWGHQPQEAPTLSVTGLPQ